MFILGGFGLKFVPVLETEFGAEVVLVFVFVVETIDATPDGVLELKGIVLVCSS